MYPFSSLSQQHLKTVSDFVSIDLARIAGGGGSGGGSGEGGEDLASVASSVANYSNKTQLTGLKTAMLKRWEKLMVSSVLR